MKKFIAGAALAMMFSVSGVLAADGGILVGGGIVLANQNYSGDYKTILDGSGTKTGLLTGMKIDWNYWYNFSEKMGIIAGIDLESRGSKLTADNATGKVTMHYIQIPLLFSYTFLPTIIHGILSEASASVGPEIGVIFRMGDDDSPVDVVNLFDYGASLNVTVTIWNRFVLGAGYNLGLTSYLKKVDGVSGGVTNSAIKVFLDYKYHPHC